MVVSPRRDVHEFAPHEQRECAGPDDAVHWVQVYSELICFLEGLLARTPDATIDRDQVLRRLAHYRTRLGRWSVED